MPVLAAALLVTPAGAADVTQYFAVIPGENVPVSITAFSSDARADVASYSYGEAPPDRPAHGKFAVAVGVSPFDNVRNLPTLIVLARTPEKLITFTFTNVTIDDVSLTTSRTERVTFGSTNYTVKYGARASASLGR
jgi:hypothetical protein